MAMVRTNITLPEETLRQVDEVAGPRGRSAYIADLVERQVKRDLQKKVFRESFGALVGKPGHRTPDEILTWVRDLRANGPDPWAPYDGSGPDSSADEQPA